jgi:nucleoside-diphosphate-sugar epimerase
MNLLVTGITGQSGKWFLRRLIQSGNTIPELNVKAIVRDKSKMLKEDLGSLRLEYLYGDLFDEDFVANALKGIDVVLHLAGIGKSEIMMQKATENSVKWMILVHTAGIYSKYKAAAQPYLLIEERINNLLKNKTIDLTILRPTMIYGNMKDENISVFIKMVDKLKFFPVISGGKYPIQPVYEKDLGEAYFQILTHREKTINKQYVLSGKEPITLRETFKVIADLLRKKNYFINVPFSIAYILAIKLYWLSFRKIDYREKVQRMVESRAISHADAAHDFGYDPVDFRTGLMPEIEQFKQTKNY